MTTKNITVRLEENLRKEAEALFDELGLTMSGAITIFLKQAVREQRIPFEIRKDLPADAEKWSANPMQLARLQRYMERLAEWGENSTTED